MAIDMNTNSRRGRLRAMALAVVVGASTFAAAAAQPQPMSDAARQRVRAELHELMAELIQSGAFGDTAPQALAMDVDVPAQRVSNLGLLVDNPRADGDGLRVVGVTPGGIGEHLGLRSGDRLLSLNGIALTGAGAGNSLRQAIDALPDGSAIVFEFRRDGRTQSTTGALSSVFVPAMRLSIGGTAAATPPAAGAAPDADGGCGRISDFDVAPRQQQLHAARIMSIDGSSAGPTGSKSYRVAAGTHVVKVAELIDARYLPFNSRLRDSGLPDQRYKTLTVDVAPNTTTMIAARLNDDKRDVWQGGAYWDPVAWKQTEESCR